MKISVALCSGASVMVMASTAMAQSAPAGAGAQPASEVVVTGSRIVRNGYSAPTPVTVATVQELQQTTPSNIPDALNKLPQFAGSLQTAGTATSGGAPNVFGGDFLNLRSFGAIRTLILMDGRRVPATAINGEVDTNTLPQMLVQRVDVVTGGASAVYGSDAVTGVVNFILDKQFSGFKAEAQDGISSRSDSRSYKIGMAGGGQVFDRGHFIWSAERYENDGITSHTDRSWAASDPVYVGTGTAANPFVLVNNARISNASLGGLVTSGPFAGQQFLNNGSLGAFNKGSPTATSTISVGGDGATYTGESLTPPLLTNQAFGRFQYELTDTVTGYVQVSASQAATDNFMDSNAPAVPTTIYSGNAFLTPAEQTALGSTPSFTISRLNRDLAADSRINQETVTLDVTAGVTGKAFNDFTWDAYYTHGQARLDSTQTNNINYPNLYAALDAVTNSSGAIVCRVTITNPGLYPGCVPINLFGVGNESAAAKAFIYQNTKWVGLNLMDDFAASLSGAAFNNWAGPVSTAFNLEYRAQSLNETSNASPLIKPVLTGIRLGQAPTTNWAYSTQAPSYGADSVWEASAETVFPLLKDLPLVESLDFNGAVRYTDYSSSGPVTTWKVGLNYEPIADLRFRFTDSRDIRAPTLEDLYAGTTISQVNINDPHTGSAGVVSQVSGGNPNLVPEVAQTWTAGLVYSPSWLQRFRVSVDYFNINISNAIGSVSGSQSATLQGCEASGGTSPLCAAIVRPLPFSNTTPANFPTLVYNENLNIAENYTSGVDVESSYNFDLADIHKSLPGHVDLRLLLTYQPVLDSRAYAGSVLVNGAGVAGFPGTPGVSSTRITSTVDYRIGPVTLDWQMRYLSQLALSGNPQVVYAGPDLPAIFYHDVSLTYQFKAQGHQMQAFLIVDNLLDQQPRISPATSSTTPGGGLPAVVGDDVTGRYYTAGLRFKF